jgi:4-amino-4-deoxy-L-arabinose transferase-like glycosyltransferase
MVFVDVHMKLNLWKFLLLAHVALLVGLSATEGFSVSDHDEPIYFGAGSVIWHRGEVANKMTEPHPPFTYYLNSLFLGSAPIDWSRTTDWFRVANETNDDLKLHFLDSIGFDLVRQTEEKGGSVRLLMLRGRIVFILISVTFAAGLYLTLRRWNEAIALGATSLYAFSPLVLFTAPGIMTDLTMTFFATLAALSLAVWSENGNRKTAALSGLYMGLAMASKVSAILLLPVCLAATMRGLARRTQRIWSGGAISIIAACMTVWGAYGFQVESLRNVERLHHLFPVHERLGQPPPSSRLAIHYPQLYEAKFPAVSFLFPLRLILHRSGNLERTPLPGPLAPFSQGKGYAWAALVTYFPIGFFVLFLGALGYLRRVPRADWIASPWCIAMVWPILYAAVAFRSSYFYGSRHLFPIMPILLFLSGLVVAKNSSSKAAVRMAMAMTALTLLEAAFFLLTREPLSLWVFLVKAS